MKCIKQMLSGSLNYCATDNFSYIWIYLHLEAQIVTDESDVQLRKGFNYAKGAVIAGIESVAHDIRRRGGEERRKYPFSDAMRLFFPYCLVVRTRHTETNSPERECATGFTTRGRVYGCFSTDVVNA